jgi:hypothetical protein
VFIGLYVENPTQFGFCVKYLVLPLRIDRAWSWIVSSFGPHSSFALSAGNALCAPVCDIRETAMSSCRRWPNELHFACEDNEMALYCTTGLLSILGNACTGALVLEAMHFLCALESCVACQKRNDGNDQF